ncbi:peroxiredoxin [Thiofilum flexile]|uniref:peroxiredoxin n=1 Tax=Thiofilum flexile TaxID=125627 RepID=UPI00037CC34F|nr:peroxiredoxin [Thiofilum flexile]
MLELNQPIIHFSAPSTSDKIFNSTDCLGSNLVVYFYPKDNTPGCTTESHNFRDLYPQFQDLNTIIVGVSRDSLRSHENFKTKHQLPFELIADPDERLCRTFDVIKLKTLYGKQHLGIERSTFLIDAAGVLRREWRKVRVPGHAEMVLMAVQSLPSFTKNE